MKLEFLQKELERVSDWIRFADRKTAFLSIYYTGILTYSLKNINIFKNTRESDFLICIALILAIAFLIGIYYLLLSIFPRLENKLTNKTLFYFGSVSNMKVVDFFEDMKVLSEEKAKKQIIEQIYTNSEIAYKKMQSIQKSIKFLVVTAILLIILMLK